MEQYKYVVYGKVQNVWFRKTTREKALNMHVQGWVKNNPDRTVTVLAQYKTEDQKLSFEEFLKEGPEFAIVENIQKEKVNDEDHFDMYDSFEIVL